MTNSDGLSHAIELSARSVNAGGFPVGAILVGPNGEITTGLSNGKQLADPTSHAEVSAIRTLCAQLGRRNLKDYTLYSSMEPCLMCYGAAFWASIPRIVYAASKTKLSWQHFEGSYSLEDINATTRRPIEIIHFAKLEPDALAVINSWEQNHAAPAIMDSKRGEPDGTISGI